MGLEKIVPVVTAAFLVFFVMGRDLKKNLTNPRFLFWMKNSSCPSIFTKESKQELMYETLVRGLAYFEGLCVIVAMLLYSITILHIVLVQRLKDISCLIQFNLCLILLVNHVAMGTGYMVSPCRPWSLDKYDTFVYTCQMLSGLQLGAFVALFTWIFLQAFYLQICASNVRWYYRDISQFGPPVKILDRQKVQGFLEMIMKHNGITFTQITTLSLITLNQNL